MKITTDNFKTLIGLERNIAALKEYLGRLESGLNEVKFAVSEDNCADSLAYIVAGLYDLRVLSLDLMNDLMRFESVTDALAFCMKDANTIDKESSIVPHHCDKEYMDMVMAFMKMNQKKGE